MEVAVGFLGVGVVLLKDVNWELVGSYAGLLAMATFCVYVGAYGSLLVWISRRFWAPELKVECDFCLGGRCKRRRGRLWTHVVEGCVAFSCCGWFFKIRFMRLFLFYLFCAGWFVGAWGVVPDNHLRRGLLGQHVAASIFFGCRSRERVEGEAFLEIDSVGANG